MNSASILSIKPFKRLWLGQAVSQFGDALYFLVFLFMVDRSTEDPRMVGAVAAIQAIPYLLMSMHAGVLADRLDRRAIMIFSDFSSFLILILFSAYLWFVPVPNVAVMFVTAFLLSFVNVFFAPAKTAMIPTIVPAARLAEANSLSAATQHLMPLIGLAVSGGLLSIIEKIAPGQFFTLASLVNSVTFLVSFSFILKLPKGLNLKPRTAESTTKNFKLELLEGIDLVKGSPFLKSSLLLSLALNFFISPFMLVYIAANRLWFGGEYWKLALAETSFAFAMLVTSFAIGKMRIHYPGKSLVYGLGFTAIFVALMGVFKDFPAFVLFNLLCGIGVPFASLPLLTHLQLTIPNELMGRYQGISQITSMAVVPVANGIGGVVLGTVGPENMFLIMGAGLLLSTFCGLFYKPFFSARTPIPELTS